MVLKKHLFSEEFKIKIVLEVIQGKKDIDKISEEYKIQSELIFKWKKAFLKMVSIIFDDKDQESIETKLKNLLNEDDFVYSKDSFWKLVVDNIDNMVNICDMQTYEVLYANKVCKEIYEICDDENYRHSKCYELFHNKTSPCGFCDTEKLYLKGKHKWKVYNKKNKKYYELTDVLFKIDGRETRMQIGVDINEDQNQIKALDSKINLDKTLFDCIRTLTETSDLKQAIEKMLEIVCKYYNGDRGYIFECSKDDKLLNNTYEWCREGVTAEIDNLQNIPKNTAKHWFENFEEIGNFYISNLYENLDENSPDYKILEAQGIKSLMAAPLREDGQIKGFIGVDDPQSKVDDFSLLSSVTYFVVNDIQKRRLIAELEAVSYVDSLTQLYNRNKYIKDLESIERKMPDTLGVAYIDLNGLKVANDKFGHNYGDYLLKKLANILNEIFKDKIYRVGGDEFLIFCPNISKNDFENLVILLRKSIKEATDLTAAVGTTWEEKKFNVNNLIKHADDLMYANKQRYYELIQVTDYNHNSSIARQLINDLDSGRYKVFLQPKINLSNNKLCGAEALIRGIDKDGNLIYPDFFIPVYEAHGIIRHIDFFVLETVCKLISGLEDKKKKIGNISVNFSRTTLLEYNVVKHMLDICKKYKIDPCNITIEVTESADKLQLEELIVLVSKIKEAGFDISLDDYGTKYSNMAVLSNIGFDEIKLDRSIVSELTINDKTRTIIQYTIRMFKELNKCIVVAEGIETLEELDIVKQYGCDCGQGYHFSRPISIEKFLNKYF